MKPNHLKKMVKFLWNCRIIKYILYILSPYFYFCTQLKERCNTHFYPLFTNVIAYHYRRFKIKPEVLRTVNTEKKNTGTRRNVSVEVRPTVARLKTSPRQRKYCHVLSSRIQLRCRLITCTIDFWTPQISLRPQFANVVPLGHRRSTFLTLGRQNKTSFRSYIGEPLS